MKEKEQLSLIEYNKDLKGDMTTDVELKTTSSHQK